MEKRRINMYDPETGKFIQTYGSLTEVARRIFQRRGNYKVDVSRIANCCKHKTRIVGKEINGKYYYYGFEYAGEKSRYPIDLEYVAKTSPKGKIKPRFVDLYDALTGQKLKSYSSLKEASIELNCGVSQIYKCCQHKTKTVKGYGLEYSGEKSRYPIGEKFTDAVKIDAIKDGVVVQTYNSMKIAAAFLGVAPSLISYSLQHKGHKVNGYEIRKHI